MTRPPLLPLALAVLVLGCQSATAPPLDSSIDFTAVRTQFGERSDFHDLCEAERPLQQFIELANAERWSELLEISKPWLAKCPIDIDARFVTAIALAELGRDDLAKEHVIWHLGLVRSILASGDGRRPETAFVVVSVAEEYGLLRTLNYKSRGQKLLDGRIDAISVEDRDGRTFTVHFNPAAHFRRLDRALGTAH